MYFSSWFQSFICINLFDSMKVNKLFWYCLCLFILATEKIKFAWKSTFSLHFHWFSPSLRAWILFPPLPNLLTIYWPHRKEKSVAGDLFENLGSRSVGALSGQVIPPLTGATCLPEHPGGIGARNSRNLNSFHRSSKLRKTYREDGEFSGTLN